MKKKFKLTIIGFGVMGKKYAGIFSEGFDVYILSGRNVEHEAEQSGAKCGIDFENTIRASDFILLAIPLTALDSVVARLNKLVRPETVVMDICSAQIPAHKKMSQLKCKFFGIHADCVIGSPDNTILNYLGQKGYTFRKVIPEEHDKENSIIGLVHFIGIVLDSFFGKDDRSILSKSPAAQNILRLIEHLSNNSPSTYRETQIDNGYMANRRIELLRAIENYHNELSNGEFPFKSNGGL